MLKNRNCLRIKGQKNPRRMKELGIRFSKIMLFVSEDEQVTILRKMCEGESVTMMWRKYAQNQRQNARVYKQFLPEVFVLCEQ